MATSPVDNTSLGKFSITSNAPGPRYAWTSRGMEVIRPKETVETMASALQIAEIERQKEEDGSDRFTVETIEAPAGDDGDGEKLDSLTVVQLRKIADEEGVQLTGRPDPADATKTLPDITLKADIVAAIEAKRAG